MTINKSKGISFFLEKLSIQELKEIKHDFQLIKKGYEFGYVIDTYDIVNFSLPFIDKDSFKKLTESQKYYTTIAYERVFAENPRFSFCLPDEYKVELLSIQNSIKSKVKSFDSVHSNILKIIDEFTDKSVKKASDLIKENLEVLIASMIYADYENNIYDRFINFSQKKLMTFEYSSNNKKIDSIVNEIFSNTRQSNLSKILYSEFVSEVRTRLIGLEDDLERYRYLENSFRDIIVIDRVFNINKKLQKRNVNRIFLYLSSAPMKTDKLFEILNSIPKYSLKVDDVKNFDFHRNIYQLFLFDFLEETFNKNQDSVFSFLDLLIDFRKEKVDNKKLSDFNKKYKEDIETKVSKSHQALVNLLGEIINSSAILLDNSILHSTYQVYDKKIKEVILSLSDVKHKKKLHKVMSIISDIVKNSKVFTNNLDNAIVNLEKIKQTSQINNKIKYLHSGSRNVFIPLGNDIIKNAFHHLPFLLLLKDENTKLRETLLSLFNNISDYPMELEKLSSKFEKNIFHILSLINSQTGGGVKDNIREFLILSFINLISPSNNNINDEKELCNTLINRKELLGSSRVRPKLEQNNSLILTYERKEKIQLEKELDYFIIWTYRRLENYEESIRLCDDYILKYKNTDPRFLHGRGLTYCALAYKNYFSSSSDSNAIVVQYLEYSIRDLSKAQEGYLKILKNKTLSKNEIYLLYKNIIAILNNILDSEIRKIKILGDTSISEKTLRPCREILFKIKSIWSEKLNLDLDAYNTFPTLNHSETELEYYEALNYYQCNELENAEKKIMQATIRYHNFRGKESIINKYFNELIKLVDELRNKIFEKLGFFS